MRSIQDIEAAIEQVETERDETLADLGERPDDKKLRARLTEIRDRLTALDDELAIAHAVAKRDAQRAAAAAEQQKIEEQAARDRNADDLCASLKEADAQLEALVATLAEHLVARNDLALRARRACAAAARPRFGPHEWHEWCNFASVAPWPDALPVDRFALRLRFSVDKVPRHLVPREAYFAPGELAAPIAEKLRAALGG